MEHTSSQNFSFDELPKIVHQLSEQISRLSAIIEVTKPTTNESDLITRNEAKELLKITDPTLWTWAKQGKIKTYKIGNKVYLKRSEIKEIIDQNITKK